MGPWRRRTVRGIMCGMALLVPDAYSLYSPKTGIRTYADATRTEGGRLAKYIMAQFRSDSELSWIAEVRRELATDELKWPQVKENRPKLEPRILLEDREKSYHAPHRVTDHDLFDNRLIFGDNLLALKALEQEFTGKIKCIYIDPRSILSKHLKTTMTDLNTQCGSS